MSRQLMQDLSLSSCSKLGNPLCEHFRDSDLFIRSDAENESDFAVRHMAKVYQQVSNQETYVSQLITQPVKLRTKFRNNMAFRVYIVARTLQIVS